MRKAGDEGCTPKWAEAYFLQAIFSEGAIENLWTFPRIQELTGLSGHSGKYPKNRQHEVRKTFNSEYGELRNVSMKELTLNCGSIRHLQHFPVSLPSDFCFQEFMGRLSKTVQGPKSLASLPTVRTPKLAAPYQGHPEGQGE